MLCKSRVALAVLLSFVVTTAVSASTLSFDFSFTNTINANESITGIVRGLTDNSTGAAASVETLSNSGGFGLGEYVGDTNTWTVAAGILTDYSFRSEGFWNSPPAVTCCSLSISSDFNNQPEAGLFPVDFLSGLRSGSGLVFTPAEIPLPAGFPLLLAGLAGLAGLRLKKNRAARA